MSRVQTSRVFIWMVAIWVGNVCVLVSEYLSFTYVLVHHYNITVRYSCECEKCVQKEVYSNVVHGNDMLS